MTSSSAILILIGACIGAAAICYVVYDNLIASLPADASKKDAWEFFSKIATTCLSIVAGLAAVLQYFDQRDREEQTKIYEAAQKVRQFNLEIYTSQGDPLQAKRVLLNEACDLAATLATLDALEGPTAEIALDRFERLYHGQLVLYENDEISDAMIDLRDAILKWRRAPRRKPVTLTPAERSPSRVNEELPSSRHNSDFMRRLALELAHRCRRELDRVDAPPSGGAAATGASPRPEPELSGKTGGVK